MRNILLVVALILALSPCLAQHGTVMGKVVNIENDGLELYTIWTEPTSQRINTETDGSYSLELIPGEYDLFVGNNGLTLQTVHIEVEADEKITHNFILEDIVQLSNVQLFGSVNKQPEKLDQITRLPLKPTENIQTITTISEKVIERQGILTISDATRNAPGLYTYATYGNTRESLGSRGFRGIP